MAEPSPGADRRLEEGRQNELSDILNEIAQQYPDTFAGAENYNGSFVVHTVETVPDMQSVILAAPELRDTPIRFVAATWSLDQLYETTRRIAEVSSQLRNQGIPLVAWGPDIAKNAVVVHLESHSSGAAGKLRRLFGPSVFVAEEPMEPAEY